MAVVTNAALMYSQQANREDLSNAIYNIDPFDTPFMTLAGRRNVTNRIFDWQTEALPAVNTGNALEEGFSLARSASNFTVRLNNTVQISARDATVSGSADNANAAGKSKGEMAAQMALISKALKRDMESILCSAQARSDGTQGAPTRLTRAFEHWIQTNVSTGVGYGFTNATTALTDGTQRQITETMLNDVLQNCYTAGAEPDEMFVGAAKKRTIATFTGRGALQNISIKGNEVVNTIDLYKSDFGNIKIRPSRWIRQRTAFLIDPQYVKVAYYRPFKTVDIGTIGDADTKMILAEYGLEVGNEKAHAKIADLTTVA
jgi:hypothetical protein